MKVIPFKDVPVGGLCYTMDDMAEKTWYHRDNKVGIYMICNATLLKKEDESQLCLPLDTNVVFPCDAVEDEEDGDASKINAEALERQKTDEENGIDSRFGLSRLCV